MQAPAGHKQGSARRGLVGNFPAFALDSPTAGLLPLHHCPQSSLPDWHDAASPTLSANSFGPSDYISTPFCKHCAIATVGLQLSTHNRLSRFLQPPCALSPLTLGSGRGWVSPFTNHTNSHIPPPLGRGRGWVFPFHQPPKQPVTPPLGRKRG